MTLVASGLDRYVEPAFTTLVGLFALVHGTFLSCLAVRRKSVHLALSGVVALTIGAVFVLWGIGAMKNPFADQFLLELILSILVLVRGYQVGGQWRDERRKSRRTRREVVADLMVVVAILMALTAIWWVVPRGYESTALLGALALTFVCLRQLRHREPRQQALYTQDSAGD